MPEVTKEYSLDMLTESSVSVYVKTYVVLEEGGTPQMVGRPVRTSYSNNPSGRSAILSDLPENFAEGILAVWGNEPTLPDPPRPNVEEGGEQR